MRTGESIAATPAAAEPERGPRCSAPETPGIAGLPLAALPLAGLSLAASLLAASLLAALLWAPERAAGRQAPFHSGGRHLQASMIAAEPYGRWERNLRRCRLERRGGSDGERSGAEPSASQLRQGCRTVRLDQQEQGVLSVRFLAGGSAPGAVANQLSFAGVMESGSRPMQCQQLRCRPDWPIQLRVSAVATSAWLASQGASPLQQGHLAQGRCQLSARMLRCHARSNNGEEWLAEGHP